MPSPHPGKRGTSNNSSPAASTPPDVIRCRPTNLKHLHPSSCIGSSRRNHCGELLQRNMVRTRAGHQRSTGRQHLHRPQVQLLVPAHRALGRALRLRKRRAGSQHDRLVSLTIPPHTPAAAQTHPLRSTPPEPSDPPLDSSSTPDSGPPPQAPHDSHPPLSPSHTAPPDATQTHPGTYKYPAPNHARTVPPPHNLIADREKLRSSAPNSRRNETAAH